MTKPGQRVEINNFVQGLITEANPVNFPENASREEENFELNRDGSRDRRLGMDLEPDYTLNDLDILSSQVSQAGINTFKWTSVGGVEDQEFLAVQINQDIYFYDITKTTISRDGLVGQVNLSSFPNNVPYSFCSVNGRLTIVGGSEHVAVITYDTDAETFSTTYKTLKVRDVWGVEVSGSYETDPLYRGTSVDFKQIYNLYNQSWGIPRKNSAGTLDDPLAMFYSSTGYYPSNSETVWRGMEYQAVASGSDPFERFYPQRLIESAGVKTVAAKGYFIIDLLRRGQSRVTEMGANYTRNPQIDYATFPAVSDYSPGGATLVAEFSGRVFYSGFQGDVIDGDARSPDLANFVVFSQLVKSTDDIFKCYQEGDPTSREDSDVVDTDGGFVRISGAREIIALQNIGSHLIVIAKNGVWAIHGGGDYGFTATNYKVEKLSTYGGLSASSVITDNSRVFYMASDSIYVVEKNQFGDLGVSSITEATIQRWYDEIGSVSKRNAIGTYDPYNKKMRWIIKSGELFTETSETIELVLDTVLKAFYVNRIYNLADESPEVVGMFQASPFQIFHLFDPVLVGLDLVYSTTEQVGTDSRIRVSNTPGIVYVVIKPDGETAQLSFARYYNTDFKDWELADGTGVDAKAFLLTGAITGGDSAVRKQVPYLVMHFRRTENTVSDYVLQNESSCKVRSVWDWATSTKSNKWSPAFQAYRLIRPYFPEVATGEYDNGFETVTTKNKIRGRGRAFSFYMETEPGKDCRILGWNLTINGNGYA